MQKKKKKKTNKENRKKGKKRCNGRNTRDTRTEWLFYENNSGAKYPKKNWKGEHGELCLVSSKEQCLQLRFCNNIG
jgi:hypothetical protein